MVSQNKFQIRNIDDLLSFEFVKTSWLSGCSLLKLFSSTVSQPFNDLSWQAPASLHLTFFVDSLGSFKTEVSWHFTCDQKFQLLGNFSPSACGMTLDMRRSKTIGWSNVQQLIQQICVRGSANSIMEGVVYGIKLGAVGWEAQTLPLCSAAPIK